MHQVGRDRYSSLLHTLHAGRELPLQSGSRRDRIAWHPIAGKLVRVAMVAVLLYLAISAGLALWRDVRVDVWAGPDAAVTSGQRLADCPLVGQVSDQVFPNWIRFEGKVYLLTDSIRPMGFQVDSDFPATGYSLGQMAPVPDREHARWPGRADHRGQARDIRGGSGLPRGPRLHLTRPGAQAGGSTAAGEAVAGA